MTLYVLATPIGNIENISEYAKNFLKNASFVIGEEKKESLRRLKHWELTPVDLELLNEHSDKNDIQFLIKKIKKSESYAVLISDCGTPAFCDPGADLVKACMEHSIKVQSIGGPSSLASLLSVCGERLDEFYFAGFLSKDSIKKKKQIDKIKKMNCPTVIMERPYKLNTFLEQCEKDFANVRSILGLNLGTEKETVIKGSLSKIKSKVPAKSKEEFVLLLNY